MANRAVISMSQGRVERARRFVLNIPFRYRVLGENVWFGATIENISATGILFFASNLLPTDTLVEISLELPTDVVGGLAGRVVSKALVVRSSPTCDPEDGAVMALKLIGPRLRPPRYY